jgi:predicted membrane protein
MKKIVTSKVFWRGLFLITIGVLLFMKNFNLLSFNIPPYIVTWKMLLVVIGVYALLSWKHIIGGLVMIGIGSYFLIPEILGIPPIDIVQLWPLAFVLVGIALLMQVISPNKKKASFNLNKKNQTKEDYMESTVIFSGDSKQISSFDFKGGTVTAICGGLEIDLVNCSLSNEKNVIEINAIMGGVTLIVPKEWNVISEIVAIMGGVADNINEMRNINIDPKAEITLTGAAIMGGVEIKRV